MVGLLLLFEFENSELLRLQLFDVLMNGLLHDVFLVTISLPSLLMLLLLLTLFRCCMIVCCFNLRMHFPKTSIDLLILHASLNEPIAEFIDDKRSDPARSTTEKTAYV